MVDADLLPPLEGAGPLTVFAPTDEAFAALNLPPDTDPAVITNVLLYHVAPGEVAFQDGLTVPTLNGATVQFSVTGAGEQVNDSLIIDTIDASNGIIYVIDGVLLPPEPVRQRNLRVK